MARGLRGGNIGEEPFFFKSDGVFISGDLVKPVLYLRKNYMIAPAVSSPARNTAAMVTRREVLTRAASGSSATC